MRSRHLDIDDRTQDLAELLRDDPAVAEDFHRKYELSWIFHENALEGLVFTGQELETALSSPPVSDVASLNATRDIRNLKAAIDLTRNEAAARKPRITVSLVKTLYETLHAGVESRAGTGFRNEIPLHRAYFHEIAHPAKIVSQLDALIEWTESSDCRGAHPLQRASRLQHGFMRVYPYTDGSGKIARLLANLILIHEGYQPCVIHMIDRQRYYESLKLGEPQLRDLMMDSMDNALASAEKLVREFRTLRARRVAR